MSKKIYKIVDLFAGCGGLSCGLEQAGFTPWFVNEIIETFCNTYKRNHNLDDSHYFVGDINELNENLDDYKEYLEDITLVCGGPPCQGFSMANRQRILDDPRNQLYKAYLYFLSQVRPKFFIMENVKGMSKKIEEIKDDIKLKGKILGKEYTWKIAKEEITNTDVDLEVLFAKQEIERLEDYIKNTYDYEKIENYKKMIIDIAVKYNINSEYTSFITVYERENKLLDVPQYQETTLSNKVMFDAFEGIDAMDYECEESFSGSAQRMFNTSNLFGASADTHSVKGSTKGSGALNIPSFMKRSRVISPKYEEALRWDAKNHETTELLDEKINEYYEKFIKQEEKSILTYLLYALYDLKKATQKIDYEKLIQFLEIHKQEIRKSELYMQLICRYYKDMEINFIGNREKLLNIIDEDYKKLILTNFIINVLALLLVVIIYKKITLYILFVIVGMSFLDYLISRIMNRYLLQKGEIQFIKGEK
ncbi:MAG: DNA cytosine methyltransferase [[Ruminococcus] faecis]|nr:DNA cytosine methyltransferase [Mediterraneibacter faecis]